MPDSKFIYQLAKIEMGPPAVDGGMSTSLVEILSNSVPGTVSITSADPTVTSIRALEFTRPIISTSIPGDTTVAFSSFNVHPVALQKIFGGTLTGTAPNQKWNAPEVTTELIQSLRFTTPGGSIIDMPKVSLFPKLDIIFDEGDAGKVAITGTVLQPDKAGVSAIII